MIVRRQGEPAALAEWRRAGARRRVDALGLWSEPGVFSWDRLDPGTALLLEQLPEAMPGCGMDLCCGHGVLAHAIVQRAHPGPSCLHLVDADARALACARLNLAHARPQVCFHWLDATVETLPARLDWIVCNPPFHQGAVRSTELGQRIVARACAALRPGGALWLVANRQLPYERVLRAGCAESRCVVQREGFKVLYGRR